MCVRVRVRVHMCAASVPCKCVGGMCYFTWYDTPLVCGRYCSPKRSVSPESTQMKKLLIVDTAPTGSTMPLDGNAPLENRANGLFSPGRTLGARDR